MTKKQLLTRVLPAIVIIAIVVFLIIHRESYFEGIGEAANALK